MPTYTVTLTTTLTSLQNLLTTAGYSATQISQGFGSNAEATLHTMTADYAIRGVNETTGTGVPIPSRQLAVYNAGGLLPTLFSSPTSGTLLYIRID